MPGSEPIGRMRDALYRGTRYRTLRRLRAVSWSDWKLLFRAVRTVTFIRAAVHLMPAIVLLRWVERTATRRLNRQPANRIAPERHLWALRLALRIPPRATCLCRAISGRLFLASAGYPADLRIGVRRDDKGQFRAHAWLESEGDPIIGGHGVEKYATMPDLRPVVMGERA